VSDDELSFAETNRAGVEFVLTDLDAALTFMDIAARSGIEETVQRNHKNARHAYDIVLRLLQHLTPDADQRSAIDAKIAALKARLQAVGQQF
jgi:hypothetical protein